jgi:hypothetical protein
MTNRKHTAQKPQVDTRGGLYDAKGNDHNPLTRETAYELLRSLHAELTSDGEMTPCADFLLLLYALAYEDSHPAR